MIFLQPPKDQDLRNMRHYAHCQDPNGIIGYYPQLSQRDIINSIGDGHGHYKELNTDEMVDKNIQVNLGEISSINDFNRCQLDMLAYTYLYHIHNNEYILRHVI